MVTLVVLVELTAICQSASTNELGQVAGWQGRCSDEVMHFAGYSQQLDTVIVSERNSGATCTGSSSAHRRNEQKVVETISCHDKQVADSLM